MAAAEPRPSGRSALRPGHRASISPRYGTFALAPRQGTPPVHVRADCARPAPVRTWRHLRFMSLLFDAPVLPGLAIRDDAITELQEHALIEALEALDLAPFRFQQWTWNRKTLSFG